MKRLIVNADDLGLHRGINAGILHCHREGIVTSASLSPNGEAFDDAVRLLKQTPDLDLGIHLTLVAERSVSDPASVPTLAPGGRFPAYFTTLFRRLLLGQVDAKEIEHELSAQVQRARDAGLRPSHLDSHQHVHLHPALLPVVLRVAQHFGIKGVRAAARVVPLSGLRPALLSLFAQRASRRVRRAGLETPDACLGLAETGRLSEPRLLKLLQRLQPGTNELICHPGHGDGTIAKAYSWGFGWDAEAEALTSQAVREALARERIRLVSYRDL